MTLALSCTVSEIYAREESWKPPRLSLSPNRRNPFEYYLHELFFADMRIQACKWTLSWDDWSDRHWHCSYTGSQSVLFQQDGASTTAASITHDWLQANFFRFIEKAQCPKLYRSKPNGLSLLGRLAVAVPYTSAETEDDWWVESCFVDFAATRTHQQDTWLPVSPPMVMTSIINFQVYILISAPNRLISEPPTYRIK